MNDLDICKRIAEIEGYKVNISIKCEGIWCSRYDNNCYGNYNPLTDNALCFQLMIKYSVNLNIQDTSRKNVFHKYIACVDDFGVGLDKTSPNKAICLAIIEANKGK